MSIVPDFKPTGFPFGFSRTDYADVLQHIPTSDLIAEVEAAQWLALGHAGDDDGSRTYIEHQLGALVAELERRRRLSKEHHGDPLRPTWPKKDEVLQDRVRAVKAAWPIERFCRDLLACDLVPVGPGRWKARCPLPGHDDRTPSFSIDAGKDVAYCHGCGRGGDVIKLTQYALNVDRFRDALDLLERKGGVR